MGTYLDLDGEFEKITKEQDEKFEEFMKGEDAPIGSNDVGYFSFHGNCSYSYWDRFSTALQEFCVAEKVCCTVTSECEGERGTDYFGSDDDQNRLYYFDTKVEYESKKREMDKFVANTPPADIARWTLEGGK